MQTKWVYLTECMCHLAKLLHSLIIYRLLLYVVLHIYSICKIGKSSTSHSQQYIAYLNNLSSNLTQSDKGYSCEQCFMQNKTCIWPTACSFTDSGMHPAPKLSHIRQHSFVPLRRLKMDGGNGKRFFFFFLKLWEDYLTFCRVLTIPHTEWQRNCHAAVSHRIIVKSL